MIDETWQAVAAGLLNAFLAQIVAITNQDSRRVVNDARSWQGWIRQASFGALGSILAENTIGRLMNEIPDRVYVPVLRDQVSIGLPPLPTGASAGGGTIVVDDPGVNYETYVFEWASGGKTFTELGDLASNSTPGAGVYVVAHTFSASPGDVFGLPSAFLTI